MKLCYCDESGTGDEPIAVMVGIVVDSVRMHLTKDHWQNLLKNLSDLAGRQIVELHTRDFYSGSGVWHGIRGDTRSEIMQQIFEWLIERKHSVVYTSVVRQSYHKAVAAQNIPDELNTLWRFMGFHLILAMQKYGAKHDGVKGHTLFVFDNEERERMRFTDLISRPPNWSDEYYDRGRKQDQLDQIIDVPYFGDSKEVALIQVADFFAYLLRLHCELETGHRKPAYRDEVDKVGGWIEMFAKRSIGSSYIFPARGRQYAHDLFFEHAPECIRAMR